MDNIEILTPITSEQFIDRILNKVHQTKKYYSIYLTTSGEILDCRYPQDLGHNEFSILVYENIENLPQKTFSSNLNGLYVPFKEIPFHLESCFNLVEILNEDIRLFWTIDKNLLGTEDRICQDMGFVKISINDNLKTSNIVIPNSIFGKRVTAHQKETLETLSNFFNIDLITMLKTEQKENAKIASQIQQTLNKIHSNNP